MKTSKSEDDTFEIGDSRGYKFVQEIRNKALAESAQKKLSKEEKPEKRRKKKKWKNYIQDDIFDSAVRARRVYPPSPIEEFCSFDHCNEREGNFVPDWMLLDPSVGGFHFGKVNLSNGYYIGKPQSRDGHILVIGIPGSHKTSAMVIPTFGTWKGHIITIDVKPKGDLLPQCKRLSLLTGKQTKVFSPFDENACGYDPFAYLRLGGNENLARNAKELAISLIATIPESKDLVWIKLAQNLLAGVVAHHFVLGATFGETMAALQLLSVKDLIKDIYGSENAIAKMFVGNLKNLKPEILADIGMDLTELAILSADPRIESALCGDGKADVIDWNELNTAETPFNIVLQIPEEYLDVWEPMVKLLINQLIRTLERRPDKYSKTGKKLPPVLIMLDEFASLGKISSIKTGLATLRSRGVTFCFVIQNLSQLDEIYGSTGRRTILDLCQYKAILNVTEPESQKYFSDLIGSLVVPSKSASTTHNPVTYKMDSYSLQVNESREPIIFPHEFATLKDIVLLTPDGYCRVEKAPYYSTDAVLYPCQQKIICDSEAAHDKENYYAAKKNETKITYVPSSRT